MNKKEQIDLFYGAETEKIKQQLAEEYANSFEACATEHEFFMRRGSFRIGFERALKYVREHMEELK